MIQQHHRQAPPRKQQLDGHKVEYLAIEIGQQSATAKLALPPLIPRPRTSASTR